MPLVTRSALLALLFAAGLAAAAAPPTGIDSSRVITLLLALDDDSFDVRQSADEELRGMGRAVVAYLREEHLRSPSLEVKARLGRMIDDLTVGERIPALVKQLGHDDSRFRVHAELTLRKASMENLPALEAELATWRGEGRRALERIIAAIAAGK